MADQYDRRAELTIQILQELQDLSLHGYIEGSGRLVRNQQRRLIGEAHGDHRSLAHAPAELMRIVLCTLLRGRNAHALQQRNDPLFGLPLVESRVGAHRLLDLESDTQHRVEGGHGVLEDHRDVATAVLEQLAGCHADDVLVVDEDLAARDAPGFGDKVEDRERRHRFAAPRFSDDAKGLTGVHLEADPVDRTDGPGRVAELRREVHNPKQSRGYRRILGSIASRSPSPSQLKASTVNDRATHGASTMCGAIWIAL